MRTTFENKESLNYNLSLEGANISAISSGNDGTSLTRSCFYDFAAEKRAGFSRFSDSKSCGFVAALFEDVEN